MSVDAIPHLDDREARGVVVLRQQLARTAPRRVADEADDRAQELAERRGFAGFRLELVDPRNGQATPP